MIIFSLSKNPNHCEELGLLPDVKNSLPNKYKKNRLTNLLRLNQQKKGIKNSTEAPTGRWTKPLKNMMCM